MRARLGRRVLMLLLGVPAPDRRPPVRAPRFAEYPLRRRVAAGLLGVSLERASTAGQDAEEAEATALNGHEGTEFYELTLVPEHDLPPSTVDWSVLEADSTKRPVGLHVVLAGALGVAALLTGVSLAVGGLLPDEAAGPLFGIWDTTEQGSVIDVAEPLEVGDCVVVSWKSARFESEPRLRGDPTCAAEPDGQVIAVVDAVTVAEAWWDGPAQCERRTEELRAKLADVRSFAIVPTPETFEAAGRHTACLVLGAHGPVYGPLGTHRKLGSSFADTANMQKRDCLDVRSSRDARLVSCSGPHDEKVLGFAELDADVSLAEARDESDDACARDVPPRDYGFDPLTYEAASWTSEGPWKSGTHIVVCTVVKKNGGVMAGDES